MKSRTKNNTWNNIYDIFVYYGIYYGYPDCCIEDFCNRYKNVRRMSNIQERVHGHKGFIPCEECSKLILDGKETLKSLIQNRECPTKFPIDYETK